MADLHILIDSSTKHASRTNRYGESTAAWGAWWSNNKKCKPVKAGIHYFRNEGPNKAFYQGVIGALEQSMGMCWPNSDIVIFGDCQPVINQLDGTWTVNKMQDEYDEVQALVRRYRREGITVTFQYMNDKDQMYKKIDQLAKRSREHVTKILK